MPANDAGSASVNIVPDFTEFGEQLRDGMSKPLEGELSRIGSAFSGFVNDTATRIKRLGHTATTLGAVLGQAAFAGLGVYRFVEVEKGLREVNTLFGLTGQAAEDSFSEINEQVRTLSNELGVAQTTLTQGLYQAISAGVPRENVGEFLRVATQAAIGGVTDTETAVRGLSATLNAFGLDATDTQRVADALFTTVKGGITTFELLANEMSNVAPIAAASGISLEETAAALATITSAGTSTAEATTQIRAAIQGLVRPSAEMDAIFQQVGHTNAEAALRSEGLAFALQTVSDASGGSQGRLQQLLGTIEGVAAVNVLAGTRSEYFAEQLANQEAKAGASGRAFDEMERSGSRTWERLTTAVENFSIVIGEALAPTLRRITAVVEFFTDLFSGLPKILQQATAGFGFLAAAIGPPIVLLLSMRRAFLLLRAAAGARTITEGLSQIGLAARQTARNMTSVRVAGAAIQTLSFRRAAAEIGFFAASAKVAGNAIGSLVRVINPWTIAIGGALTIFTAYNNEKRRAAQLSREYAATLNKETGAVQDSTRAKIAEELATDKISEALGRAGLGYADISNAILGTDEDVDQFRRHLLELFRDVQISDRDLKVLTDAVLDNRNAISEGREEVRRKAEADRALGVETEKMIGDMGLATDAIDDVGGAAGETVKDLIGLGFAFRNVDKDATAFSKAMGGAFQSMLDPMADATEASRALSAQVRSDSRSVLDAFRDRADAERDALERRQELEQRALEDTRVTGEASRRRLEAAAKDLRRRHEDERWELEQRHKTEQKAAEATVEAEERRTAAIQEANEASQLGFDQLQENLLTNIDDVEEWVSDLEDLAKRGHEGLAAELAALGPEAASIVDEATRRTDTELSRLEASFKKAGRLSADALSGELESRLLAFGELGRRLGVATAEAFDQAVAPGVLQTTVDALQGALDALDPFQEELAPVAPGTPGEWIPRQHGGPVWPGQDFLLGERGPEVVRFNQPGTVYPHGQTPEPTRIEMTNVFNERVDPLHVGRQIAWALR